MLLSVIFAIEEVGWIVGIGGLMTGVAAVVASVFKSMGDARAQVALLESQRKEQEAALENHRKEQEAALEAQRIAMKVKERADTIDEWKNYSDTQQRQYITLIDNLQKQNNHQAAQIDDLRKDHNEQTLDATKKHQECIQRESELRGELRVVELDLRRLKAVTGSIEPSGISSALVIADATGVIREASPAIGAILHWMRADLIGQQVVSLIPERLREKHLAGFAKFLQNKGKLEHNMSTVTLKTYALSSQGDEIPVNVTLTPWVQGNELMVSAEIARRPTPVLATQEQVKEQVQEVARSIAPP